MGDARWRYGERTGRTQGDSGSGCQLAGELGGQPRGCQPDVSVRDVRYGLVNLLQGNSQVGSAGSSPAERWGRSHGVPEREGGRKRGGRWGGEERLSR